MGTEINPAVLTDYARKLIRTKARQLVRQAGFSASDRADVEQELILRLLERSHRYDASRASVNTFVARVVNSCVVTILRERGRQKRAAGYFAQSLDAPAGDGGTLHDLLAGAADHDLADALAEAIAALPADLRALCAELPDRKLVDVARDLGVSRQHLYRSIARIRAHFQEHGLDEF